MIKPPSYKKNAVPSPRGWRHPRTGELLKKQTLTQEQIDEYLGITKEPEPEVKEEVVIDEEHIELVPVVEGDEDEALLEDMSKAELEALGREHGVELDRREKKSTLVEKMKNIIG